MSGLIRRLNQRDYGEEVTGSPLKCITLQDQLAQRKDLAQKEIERVERIETLLKNNPDIEELLNLL